MSNTEGCMKQGFKMCVPGMEVEPCQHGLPGAQKGHPDACCLMLLSLKKKFPEFHLEEKQAAMYLAKRKS